jgi:hypothetical protein
VTNVPAQQASGPRVSLPFCPPKTCLYYAGDFNSNDSNANGLYNANSTAFGEGEAWVGVKPSSNVTITGATFNECQPTSDRMGVNPTPFAVRVGIRPAQSGKLVCQTNGTATQKGYESSDACNQVSYTIKKLSKSCKLTKNRIYFINLLPTFDSTDFAYVTDVEDKPPQNHVGWKNLLDDTYFNSVTFGADYEPAWGSNGACGGIGCDAFSIALTGTRR